MMKTTSKQTKSLILAAVMTAVTGSVFAAGVNNTVAPNAALYGAEAYGKSNVIEAGGTSAFAVGYNNTVSKDNAFVYGNANKAKGTNSIAGGEYSTAAGRNSVAIGSSAQALRDNNFAIGSQARANGEDALAFGNGSYAENTATVAVGKSVKATGEGALAIGFNSEATARNSIAIGGNVKKPGDSINPPKIVASGTSSIAVGYGATAKGNLGISIGENAYSEGSSSAAIGSWSIASGDHATAVGGGHARADRAVAVGSGEADGVDSVSMGYYSRVSAEGSVGIGRRVTIDDNATNSVVIGSASSGVINDKKNVVAVGADTYSAVENSVALGNYARADEVVSTSSANIAGKTYDFAGKTADGTVSIGGKIISDYETDSHGMPIVDDNGNLIPIVDKTAYRTITNVAAGRVSATSTDAVNGSQLNATVEAINKNHQAAADAMAEAKKHGSVVAGDNVVVTTSTNNNGGVEYKVATKKDVELSSASFGSVSDPVHNTITKDGMGVFNGDVDTQYKASGMVIENRDNLDSATHDINGVTADSNGRHVAFTTDGIDAGSQIINNVKAGVADTDAVNVKQLNDSISTESVVSDNQVDNIAAVRVVNGKSTGDKNAQYGVYVSRTTVDSIAKASNRFAGDDVIKVERWSAPSNVADLTTFKYDGNKAATKTPLTYKANGVTKTTMLADGLDFTNGSNTTASVDANGVVKYDLNKDITVDSVKAGKVVADKANIAGVTIDNNGINAGGKTITNVARGINTNDAVTVGQLNDVRTAMANGDAATLNRANAYTDSRVSETTAQNAALAALHPLDFNKHDKFQIATGVGNYKNKTSVALGAFYQPNENTLLSLGATLGAHRNVVNAGATFRFGKHSEMNTDRHDALENKVKTLEETLADISAKYDELLKKVENK
jgi:autotransporter adhesin